MTPNAVTVATSDALQAFLHALFPTDVGYLDLRALPSRAQVFAPITNEDAVAAFLRAHTDEDCYIGCATRRTPTSGALENCNELHVLWVDLDFKTTPEADARTRLATFPIPPHVVVRSGHGEHAYWRARQGFRLPADAAVVQTWLKRLAIHFGGDLAATDPTRVLRSPTSRNHKYDPPRPVVLEHIEAGAISPSELDEWLPPAPTRPNGSRGDAPFAVPPTIHNGARNDTLYRSARSMHAKNFSAAAIRAALDAENIEKCNPPLPADEVATIAAHAAAQPDRVDFVPAPVPDDAVDVIIAESAPAFLARLDTSDRPPDLVAQLIPGIGSGMTFGHPRTMKTLTLLDLSLACATGTPPFQLAHLQVPRAISVLYVSEEDPAVEVRDRLRALANGRGIEMPDRLHVSIQRSIDLDDATWQHRLIDYVRTHGIALAIVDPARGSTAAVDQGPRELKPFADFLRHFQRETGAVWWLGHHEVKPPKDGSADTRARPQRASGGGLFSIVDSPLHAERVDDARVLLTPAGYKFSTAPDPFVIRLEADASSRPTWMRLVGESSTGTDAVRLALLTDHAGLSGTKVAQHLRRNKVDVLGALEILHHAGRADFYTRGQAHLWFIPSPGGGHDR
jgi:hypothetical protein